MYDVIAVYELEPIGTDYALEANGQVHWFCSVECATKATHIPIPHTQPTIDNENYADGTHCETCFSVWRD
jgi:YHS domain-containing protein